MTHADVAAVLAEALQHPMVRYTECFGEAANDLLEALTTHRYAVVKLPEGVAVEHGARVVRKGLLHETSQGKQVDLGPEREACYWNCRYGCKRPAVYAIEAAP